MSMYDSTDFASAKFARHPDGMIAANLGVGVAWHGHLDARQEFLVWRSEDEMARGGWAPVLECPAPEQHDDHYISPLAVKRVKEVQARAEKAERERDEARDAASAANHAMQEARERFRAAGPRPLPPEAITDEMIARAREEFFGGDVGGPVSGPSSARRWRAALTAALTEPTRPEGAERWETWLSRLDYLHDETGASRADLATLANDLATETGLAPTNPEEQQ